MPLVELDLPVLFALRNVWDFAQEVDKMRFLCNVRHAFAELRVLGEAC